MCRGTLSWFGEVAVWHCGFMQQGGSFHPKQQTEPAGIHFKGEIAQRQQNNTSIDSVGCASIYICSTAILLWNKLLEVYEISLMIHLICVLQGNGLDKDLVTIPLWSTRYFFLNWIFVMTESFYIFQFPSECQNLQFYIIYFFFFFFSPSNLMIKGLTVKRCLSAWCPWVKLLFDKSYS